VNHTADSLPTSYANNLFAQPPSRPCHKSLPWDIERPSSPDHLHHGLPGYDALSNKEYKSPSLPEKTLAKAAAGTVVHHLSNVKACMTNFKWLQILSLRLVARFQNAGRRQSRSCGS